MNNNGWLKVLIGFTLTLILGSYGFAYRIQLSAIEYDRQVEDRVIRRIDRLESAIVEMLRNRGN